MNIIFTGTPLAGKGTQAKLLSKKLNIPVFSIGSLLREHTKKGYEQYAMKGYNLPTSLKFDLLKEKMDAAKDGFILENFPATKDDLDIFLEYLKSHALTIHRVFNIVVLDETALRRARVRGRIDDTIDIVTKRRIVQGKDRESVLGYFKEKGLLVDIDGEGTIDEVNKRIIDNLSL